MTAPTKIGKYEIRRQIGRGAMGVVYEAFDPVIERRVAVKTLRLELFEPSQMADVRARFKREAQSAGQLAHPHIVTVYDYGDHEGTPYIVMEFLAGNELNQILGRGARLPLSEVVRLMTQLLGALTYAHERKVVHRDVKPGNIFILDDGSLKVVDFGLAHVEASNLTDTGALLGTPAYMSPEQFLALAIDERSDIFSAGVILYELLTGDKPFTGSVTSIMQKVLRQEPMEPSALNPTLATAWDTVVKRAMAKKPDARFQSARQFSETIKQVFEKGALNVSVEVTLTGHKTADLGGETIRPSPHKQQVSKVRRPVTPGSAGPEIATLKNSSKKVWTIAAIAVLGAIGVATLYLSQRPREDLAKPGPAVMTAQIDKAIMAAPKQEAAAKAEANAPGALTRSEHEAQRDTEAAAKAIGKAPEQLAALSPSVAAHVSAKAAPPALTAADKNWLELGDAPRYALQASADRRMPPCRGSSSVTPTNCFGELALPEGVKYVGEIRDGKPNGQGRMTFPGGERQVGEFKEGNRSGKVTLYRADGSILREIWKNGHLVGQSKEETVSAAHEAKMAHERAAQEKAAGAKKAAENTRVEKMATEKAAKAADEEVKKRVAAEVARLEKLRAEQAETERAAAERAAAERIAGAKAAAASAKKSEQSAIASPEQSQRPRTAPTRASLLRTYTSIPVGALRAMRAAYRTTDARCMAGIEEAATQCLAGKNCRMAFEAHILTSCQIALKESCFERLDTLLPKCAYYCELAAEDMGGYCSK